MQATDVYEFDRRGWLVVCGALAPDEVAHLHEATMDRLPVYEGADLHHYGIDDWGPRFGGLIDHPRVAPVLDVLFPPPPGRDVLTMGPAFERRLDHAYVISQRAGRGGTLHLHGGGTPHDPTQAYAVHDGLIRTGLVVVSYALTAAGGIGGGFVGLPGSHKANYPLPEWWCEDQGAVPDLDCPVLQPGDALVFTEALTHGTRAWVAPWDRLALLYKFSPRHMQYNRTRPDDTPHEGHPRRHRPDAGWKG